MLRKITVIFRRYILSIFAMVILIFIIINFTYLDNKNGTVNIKTSILTGFSTKGLLVRNMSSCRQLKVPEEIKEEIWQPVGYETDIYVYSAFLRGSKIRIVGTKLLKREQTVFCQVWYGGREPVSYVVKAEMINVPEHHGFKYTSYLFDCSVHYSSLPFAVSLVPEQCVIPMNHLKVTYKKQNVLTNFTICLQPLYFINKKEKTELKIIEFIELSKIIGAQKFVFYICNITTEINNVLMHYQRQNTIDILQWELPRNVFPDIHVRGQIAAENDCLFRFEKQSKYLVYIDIDEFIIPRHQLTWNEMMNKLPQGYGEYNFRTTLFRTHWPNTNINYSKKDVALKYNVQSFLKMSRDKNPYPHKQRSKCIINPGLVEIMGIHFAHKYKTTSNKQYLVDNNTALVHHYRIWSGTTKDTPYDVDRGILKYEDVFFSNVDRVWKDLNVTV